MTAEHAADEAGGEVIYSYDGPDDETAAVVVTPPPTGGAARADNAELDTQGLPPATQAFETFAGKIFQANAASIASAFSEPETALERLGRLQRQVAELEAELQQAAQSSTTTAAAAGEGTNIVDPLLAVAHQLQRRLEQVTVPPQEQLTRNVEAAASQALQPLASAATPVGASPNMLVEHLEARLLKLERVLGTAPPPSMFQDSSSNLGLATTTTTTTTTTSTTVVGGGSSSTSGVSAVALLAESSSNSLGVGADAGASLPVGGPGAATAWIGLSMAERLATLETTLSQLDEKDLEVRARKAKVIRQDLEAASKARNKLMAGGAASMAGGSLLGSSGSSSSRAEDSKTIADLHDQMVQLHGLTTHLPILASRLAALAHQHAEATTWTHRLSATERQASLLAGQVASLEQAVQTLKQGMTQTAEQMQANMKELDQRMQG